MFIGDFERQLEEMLCTRPRIEQAKGVLASLRRCTPQQALEELNFVSQRHNVALFELASALVDTAADCIPEDRMARPVIWLEWGDLLPISTTY